MTLLFAGHDTTTSTVTFLFYELARNPDELALLRTRCGATTVGGMPRLDMALDETLRMYPPAWIGPRRVGRAFEFGGRRVPGGVLRQLLLVGEPPPARRVPRARARSGPSASRPRRRAALPKGAYVPFGGGSRTCIGMRFGQLEVRAIAAVLLRRFRLELAGRLRAAIRQMPTIGPRGGLPVVVRARD